MSAIQACIEIVRKRKTARDLHTAKMAEAELAKMQAVIEATKKVLSELEATHIDNGPDAEFVMEGDVSVTTLLELAMALKELEA
jgi:hypothetical protein